MPVGWFIRVCIAVVLILGGVYLARLGLSVRGPSLDVEHRVQLVGEYDAGQGLVSWAAYQAVDRALAEQVVQLIEPHRRYPGARLDRYAPDSVSHPLQQPVDWNRSQVLVPDGDERAAIVLLHGLSDSPYSMRALAEAYVGAGYRVVVPRLPGHGFAPSGLRNVKRNDWSQAVRIAVRRAVDPGANGDAPLPLLVGGYSNGALLALEYALNCGGADPCPQGMVLLSPALGVSGFSRLGRMHRFASWVPAFERFAWETIAPEVDPFKFTSFPKDPGVEIHELARSVERRIRRSERDLPPVLAFQSVVDDTVRADALVGRLFRYRTGPQSRIVWYDVNRYVGVANLLNPVPEPTANGTVVQTLVTNEASSSRAVVARDLSAGTSKPLGVRWPNEVLSLSHIAIPFAVDDPVYGLDNVCPGSAAAVAYSECSGGTGPWLGGDTLGAMTPESERRVGRLGAAYVLRLRYNPFIEYQHAEILRWSRARVGE